MEDFDNPAKTNSHRWWIGSAVLAVLALAYGGLWLMLAFGSRDTVLQWIDDQRGHGFAVHYDNLEVTGFPLSIRLEFTNPGFGAPNATHPWSWEGAHLGLLFKPWNMRSLAAITSGQQVLAIPIKGKTEIFKGEAALIEAILDLSGTGAKSAKLMIEQINLKAESPTLAAIRIKQANVHVERLITGKADHQTASASLALSLKGLGGPWLAASPLGGDIQKLIFKARQMGSFDKGPLIQSLENWRDSGGTMEISKLALQHGPLKISADGTLALDDKLQPIGALTARMEGFFETIDALKNLGAVKPRDAITAKMVLGVLSRRSENGAPAHLNLALSAQGNKLYAGPIALMEIPEIDWRAFRK